MIVCTGRSELDLGIWSEFLKFGEDLEIFCVFKGPLVVTSAFARVRLVYETSRMNMSVFFFGNALIFFRTDAFSEKDGTRFRKRRNAFSEKTLMFRDLSGRQEGRPGGLIY